MGGVNITKDLSFRTNLFLNDLFCLSEFTEVHNFAHYKTLHTCDNDLNNLIKILEHDTFLATEWFKASNMKLNKDKCHLLVLGHNGGSKNLGKCKKKIT